MGIEPDMDAFNPDDGSLDEPPRSWRGLLTALPAAGAGLIPVGACPVCVAGTVGLLSAIGLGFLLETRFLLPVMAGLLGLALWTLGWKAKARHGFGPFLVGVAAAAMILAGKFLVASDPVLYAGLAGLMGTALWNAWPRGKAPRAPCLGCDVSQ